LGSSWYKSTRIANLFRDSYSVSTPNSRPQSTKHERFTNSWLLYGMAGMNNQGGRVAFCDYA
jgi:hypothetical protein